MQNHNSQQLLAITTLDKPLCLVAGAGSGKTTVLVDHYLHLVFKKKISPHHILACTFTDKAAVDFKQRMNERLQKIHSSSLYSEVSLQDIENCKLELQNAAILTLHSFCTKVLRESFGPNHALEFSVIDEQDSKVLKIKSFEESLKNNLGQNNKYTLFLIEHYGFSKLKKQCLEMLNNIQQWKSAFSTDQFEDSFENKCKEALEDFFTSTLQIYQLYKKRQQVLDFQDLEQQCIELLQNNKELALHYQNFYQAILVDEFQDTSLEQEKLIQLLWKKHLVIVGDFKQSIYSFRGARPEVFLRMQKKIEEAGGLTIILNQNYRSPAPLLQWVNHLSATLFPNEQPLLASPDKQESQSLEVLLRPSEIQNANSEQTRKYEAKAIASRIHSLLQQGYKTSDIYLLFRSKTALNIYQSELIANQIPVYVKGRESLLETQEVLDCIFAIRYYLNAKDETAKVALMRSPLVNYTDSQIAQLIQSESEFIVPKLEAISKLDPNLDTYQFLNFLFQHYKLIDLYSENEFTLSRSNNLLHFMNWVYNWETKTQGNCKDFLNTFNLLKAENAEIAPLSDQLGQGESVCLMTIHQSKGLNLPVVILPDLYNAGTNDKTNIASLFDSKIGFKIPISNKGLDFDSEESEKLKEIKLLRKQQVIEEENRIFYVAITRSVKKLILGFLPNDSEIKKYQYRSLLKESLNQSRIFAPSLNSGLDMTGVRLRRTPLETPSDKVSREPAPEFTIDQHTDVHWISDFSISPNNEKQSTYKNKLYPFTNRSLCLKSDFTVTELLEESALSSEHSSSLHHANTFQLEAAQVGTLVHEVLDIFSKNPNRKLEDIYNTAWQNQLLPKSNENQLRIFVPSLNSGLDQRVSNPCSPLETPSDKVSLEQAPEFAIDQSDTSLANDYNTWLQILQKATNDNKLNQILKNKHAYSELPFILQIDSFRLRGSIDRLYFDQKDWIVLDYKTGKMKDSYRLQLLSYCLAATKWLNKVVNKAKIYLVKSQEMLSFEFSQAEMDAHQNHLLELMNSYNIYGCSN